MSFFNEVFAELMNNPKDREILAKRVKWPIGKQIRVLHGNLYGCHLAIFDMKDGRYRAQPYTPTPRDLVASDWDIMTGENVDALIRKVIDAHKEYESKKKEAKE